MAREVLAAGNHASGHQPAGQRFGKGRHDVRVCMKTAVTDDGTPAVVTALRSAYEQLKSRLVTEHPTDRAAYTVGKSEFILAALA